MHHFFLTNKSRHIHAPFSSLLCVLTGKEDWDYPTKKSTEFTVLLIERQFPDNVISGKEIAHAFFACFGSSYDSV